jgi:hypothetical protein
MTNRFIHIYRTAVIGFVMAGFLAHLFLPLSGYAKKTSFTRWLSHNVVDTGDENETKIRDSIRKLPEQTGDFSLLLEEASQLIASHQDVFGLTAKSERPSEDSPNQFTQWLIGQWYDYHHQSSQMNGLLNESGKVFIKWVDWSRGLFGASGAPNQIKASTDWFFGSIVSGPQSLILFSPLAFGISINAP